MGEPFVPRVGFLSVAGRFFRGFAQGEEIKDMDDLTMVLFRDPSEDAPDGIRGFTSRNWDLKGMQPP